MTEPLTPTTADRQQRRFQEHVAELEAAIDRVRAIHSQDDSLLAPGAWCPACGNETPCPTIRALREP